MSTMNYVAVETMNSSAELDKHIAEALGFIEKLKERREVVAREERARKERRWIGFGETVEEIIGEEVELNVFKHWMVGSSDSLRKYIASNPSGEVDDVGSIEPEEAVVETMLEPEPKSEVEFEEEIEPEEPPAKVLNSKVAKLAAAFRNVEKPAEKPIEGPSDDSITEELEPVKETPKQVTARVMKEILPDANLSRAHINELIQAADHGVDFDTIKLFADPDLPLQQVRAARAAAERQVHEG